MNRLRPRRLGSKLHLALLVFVLVFGGDIVALVLFGFSRTQENATRRSEEGLEDQGKASLQLLAELHSAIGQLEIDSAADAARIAAHVIASARAAEADAAGAASGLAQSPGSVLLTDPRPDRQTDLVAPLQPGEAALTDLHDSAVLAQLFPSLLREYEDRTRGTSFNATAISFQSVSGVVRYYPPAGLSGRFDLTPALAGSLRRELERYGPALNPGRGIVWTSPHLDQAGPGHSFVLAAVAPVYSGNEFRGIIEVDLSIARLAGQLDQFDLGIGGFAFYIDALGEPLPTKQAETLRSARRDVNNEAAQRLFTNMLAGKSGVEQVPLDGQDMFVAYAPFAGPGGSLGVAVPVALITLQAVPVTDAIKSESDRTIAFTVLTMAVVLALGVAFVAYLSKRVMLRPIAALVEGTRAVAGGDLATRVPVRSRDELGMLAESFNTMTGQLEARNVALERERATRQATQGELDALLAAMTDVVLVLDRDARYIRVASRTTDVRNRELQGTRLHDHMPAEHADCYQELIRRAIDTGETQTVEYTPVVDGEVRWFSAAISRMSDSEVVWVARDITGQRAARETLEVRVEERTRELATLLDVSRNVNATLELDHLLAILQEQLQAVAPHDGSAVFLGEGAGVHTVASVGREGFRDEVGTWYAFEGMAEITTAFAQGQPLIIDDVRDSTPAAKTWRRTVGPGAETTLAGTRAWLGIPIVVKGHTIGAISLAAAQPGAFTWHHAELALTVANQAGIAVENARLFRQANQRAEELAALSQISADLSVDEPLGRRLDALAARVVQSTSALACSVTLIRESGEMRPGGVCELPGDFTARAAEACAAGAPNGMMMAFVRRERTLLRNARTAALDDPLYGPLHPLLRGVPWENLVIVPLMFRGRPLGTLDAYYPADRDPDASEVALLDAIAGQAAAAVENGELFEQALQRVRQLEAVAHIASNFTFQQSMSAMMNTAAAQVVAATSAVACTVTLTVGDPPMPVSMAGSYGFPEGFSEAMEGAWRAGARPITTATLQSREARLIPQGRQTALAAPVYASAYALVKDEPWDALVVVPMIYRDHPVGMIVLAYTPGQEPDQAEIDFLEAISDQVAVAVENARLFEQAQQAASLEERQRLARELHDSVSQALYGIALGARTARTLADRDPARVAEPLDYVLQLAEAALAELRALIFELRPETLEKEGLLGALDRQVTALRARHAIAVDITCADEPEAPLATREIVYRIAQEALNNVVKHAGASHIRLSVCAEDHELVLEVEDNGRGFDPAADFPGHLGLKSMRERALRAGGSVHVQSAAGTGTTVRARIPLPQTG